MSFNAKTGSAAIKDHRRTWDKTTYEIKANERLAAEREKLDEKKTGGKKQPKGEKTKRELLKPREYAVDLESKVGKQVVINKTTPSSETGGYYCDVCDCVVKDSINFLDHINGKNHQRNMGFSMRIKRSTADEVRQRLALKKGNQKTRMMPMNELRDIKEEEAKAVDMKRQHKDSDNKKRSACHSSADDNETNSDLLQMMGIAN